MSTWHNVWVGPYAEWRVAPGEPRPEEELEGGTRDLIERMKHSLATDGPYISMLDEGTWRLIANWGVSDSPVATIAGIEQECRCYMPDWRPEFEPILGPAPRSPMHFSGLEVDIVPIGAIDREAEIDWFFRVFRRDLNLLTAHYNAPPMRHWGVLSWLT